MRSKLIYVIFATVVLMAAVLVAIFLAEPVAGSSGLAHPNFPGMQSGGDGAARLEHIGTLAYVFMLLLLFLVVCLCSLGVSERHRSRYFTLFMVATLGLQWFVWWGMYASHQQFLETGVTAYFMGFPVATAWQMYGTWIGALPLIFIYCIGFRKYIYTFDDEERFNQLLADTAAKNTAQSADEAEKPQ